MGITGKSAITQGGGFCLTLSDEAGRETRSDRQARTAGKRHTATRAPIAAFSWIDGEHCPIDRERRSGRDRNSGLIIVSADVPTPPMNYMYERSICLITQGIKRVMVGGDTYVYDPRHFLITSVEPTRCVPDSQSEPRKAVPEPPLED